jgi:hypothetical protein
MREEGRRWREGEVQLPKELLSELSVSGERGFSSHVLLNRPGTVWDNDGLWGMGRHNDVLVRQWV